MMTNLINKFASYLILIGAVIVLLFMLHDAMKEGQRVRANFDALATKQFENQMVMTKNEFKKYYSHLDSIANTLDIKSRQITNVVVTRYRFRDTTISNYESYSDSNKSVRNFVLSRGCYTIKGTSYPDSIKTDVSLHDTLITYLYWKRKHPMLWIFSKKVYTSKVYSSCMNDTVSVQANIKIDK